MFLKDRVSSGDVKVEIVDKDGKLVQSIPATKRKGINMVTWNLRGTPPKMAEGGVELDFGAFTAPMVLPGDYTVKLIVGDKVVTEQVTVVHDEKGDMTVAERQQQYAAAMKLYNMQEELAALVVTINKTQEKLKGNIEQLSNKKNRQAAQEYYDKLEELRGKLRKAKRNKAEFIVIDRNEVITAILGRYTLAQHPDSIDGIIFGLLEDWLEQERESKLCYGFAVGVDGRDNLITFYILGD